MTASRITDSLRTLAPSRVKLADLTCLKKRKGNVSEGLWLPPVQIPVFLCGCKLETETGSSKNKKEARNAIFCNLAMRNTNRS